MKRYGWFAALALFAAACGGEKKSEPAVEAPSAPAAPSATVIDVPAFEVSTAAADIAKGEETFGLKGCTACHKVGGGRLVGPDLKGVLARRDLTWVKKMILRPDVMLKEDETAKKLLAEYMTPMPNQGVDPNSELPAIVAYLKSTE